jgi:hypothetical protein
MKSLFMADSLKEKTTLKIVRKMLMNRLSADTFGFFADQNLIFVSLVC